MNGARAVTVADRLIDRLTELGVSTVFGVHGANIEDVFDAAVRHGGISPVIAKHEFGAGAMADGHARISGTPGAVLTTSGGGALNVVPALAESYDSRVPVLAIIGTAPRTTVGRGGFQDMLSPPDTIDLPAVLSAVTGCCRVLDDPAEVDAALDEAAAALRRGLPATLVVPKDVQTATVRPRTSATASLSHQQAAASSVDERPIHQLAEQLISATGRDARICLWAGEEASRAGITGVLNHLATRLDATLVVSPGGRDVGLEDCAGVTGVMGHPSAHAAITDADLLVAVGCRMTLTDRAGLDEAIAHADTVHLGRHRPRLPGVRHIPTPDLAGAIHLLLTAIPPHRPSGTNTPAPREYLSTPDTGAPVRMREAVEAIGAALPAGCRVFADAGNAGAAAIHYLPFGDGRFVVALGMGGMGYGIAAGIGAAIAGAESDPCTRTVVIAGDGSFLMHGLEIHTAIEQNAPVTLVVLNNNAHGMCVTRESLYFPATPGLNKFGDTDLSAGLAGMFPGLHVRRVVDRSELHSVCTESMAQRGPNCLVVDVDPDEIPPFGPFIKGKP